MLYFVIFLIAFIAMGLTWLCYSLFWGTPPSINLAVERLMLRRVLKDPETLTVLGLVDNTLFDTHSNRLTDASPRQMSFLRRLDRDGLVLIRQYDPGKLKGQQKLTYQVMQWYFAQNLRGHRFEYHWVSDGVFMGPYPINHVFGVQVDLINFLCTYHKIKGRRSIRRYIQRLKHIPWKLAGLLESVKTRETQGVIPPKFVLEKSLVQIQEFLSVEIHQNPLYTAFMRKMAESGLFSENKQEQLGRLVKKTISEEVLPAYLELKETLQTLYLQATDEDGVWKLPNGEAYYAFLLRYHTTTDLTADEIHCLGLKEVDRLTRVIRQALSEQGLNGDEPGKMLCLLQKDPQYHFTGEDARKTIMEAYQEILDEVNLHMEKLFIHGPMKKIVVERLPEFKEPDSPIAYAQPPSLNGKQPGKMWVNLRHPENIYKWGMRTLAYHEGIPGHVYQISWAQKLRGLPSFRRSFFFNAYAEGWAVYAEQLGWELKLEDEMSNLGRLQALLWRVVRLVVDTGIHAKRWKRQQAIEYMVEKTGLPERDVIIEVERFIVMPGQACAYYLGYLKILALRHKAEATLGEKFEIKAFHDVILKNGSLPLSLLEENVNQYIDQAAGLKAINKKE